MVDSRRMSVTSEVGQLPPPHRQPSRAPRPCSDVCCVFDENNQDDEEPPDCHWVRMLPSGPDNKSRRRNFLRGFEPPIGYKDEDESGGEENDAAGDRVVPADVAMSTIGQKRPEAGKEALEAAGTDGGDDWTEDDEQQDGPWPGDYPARIPGLPVARWRQGPPDCPEEGRWPASVRFFRGRLDWSEELALLPTVQLRWMLQNGLAGSETTTALFWAVDHGRMHNARLLWRAGADIWLNWLRCFCFLSPKMLWFLDHGLVDASRRLVCKDFLLDSCPLSLVLPGDRYTTTAVVEQLTERLLECAADPNAHNYNQPPLLSTCKTTRCLELLLEAGADPNVGSLTVERPIRVHLKHADRLKLLLEASAHTEFPDTRGRLVSILHTALLRTGNSEVTRLLLEHGAPVVIDDPDDLSQCAVADSLMYRSDTSSLRLLLRYPRTFPRTCCTPSLPCLELAFDLPIEDLLLWLNYGHPATPKQVETILSANTPDYFNSSQEQLAEKAVLLRQLTPELQAQRRQSFLEPAWRSLQRATGLSNVVSSLCFQAWVADLRIRI